MKFNGFNGVTLIKYKCSEKMRKLGLRFLFEGCPGKKIRLIG